MKISKMIDALIFFKKTHGDIEVAKNSSFIGSDIIDSMIVYDDKLILFNTEKEFYLSKLKGEEDDI